MLCKFWDTINLCDGSRSFRAGGSEESCLDSTILNHRMAKRGQVLVRLIMYVGQLTNQEAKFLVNSVDVEFQLQMIIFDTSASRRPYHEYHDIILAAFSAADGDTTVRHLLEPVTQHSRYIRGSCWELHQMAFEGHYICG
jgi:hypothetical protein